MSRPSCLVEMREYNGRPLLMSCIEHSIYGPNHWAWICFDYELKHERQLAEISKEETTDD
jgi:hypothetical protein